nr:MAG: hypothetical protein [Microvirus sp.]
MKKNQLFLHGNYIYYENIGDNKYVLYDIQILGFNRGSLNVQYANANGIGQMKLHPNFKSVNDYNIIRLVSDLPDYHNVKIHRYYEFKNKNIPSIKGSIL